MIRSRTKEQSRKSIATALGDDRGGARTDTSIVLPIALALPLQIAATSSSPEQAIRTLVAGYQFDSLSYFVTREVDGVVNGDMVWTTLPPCWSAQYRREGFLAIDPRVARSRRRLGPAWWDAAELDGGWPLHRFIGEAARVGVRSGVAVSLSFGVSDQVTVTFDSPQCPVSDERREAIAASQGDLMLIAIALHECVLKRYIDGSRRPRAPALTLRERDCLTLAARGLTSADIGTKLSVGARTVNFHFSNIKSKLGAMNRSEAIARGIAMGIVSCD